MKSLISLHASQVDQICSAVESDDTPRPSVKATPEAKALALRRCRDAGISIPAAGGFSIQELDAALDKAFDRAHPSATRNRMGMKSALYAGGLILEPPDPRAKRDLVMACLMSRKTSVPLPDDRPFSMAELDALMAGKDLSIEHRLELKHQYLKAGLVQDGDRRAVHAQAAPTHDATKILDALGLDAPAAGKKLHTAAVDAAMTARGWSADRRVRCKTTLAAASIIAN
jgi:hypothetical protein